MWEQVATRRIQVVHLPQSASLGVAVMPAAYTLLIILVPLVPAFILFRFLRSTADVEGPLRGLHVKLTGPFAAYVVGVLLTSHIVANLMEPVLADTYTIVGNIQVDDAASGRPSPREVVVVSRPPDPSIADNGGFQMKMAIPRSASTAPDLQQLVFSKSGYQTATVALYTDRSQLASYGGEDYDITFDRQNHVIKIGKHIVMKHE